MPDNVPIKLSSRVSAFLEKTSATRARLAFIIDATASRGPTWDMAMQLQVQMFEEAAKLGGIEVQLIFYRGSYECRASSWAPEPHTLTRMMGEVLCRAGQTQIGRAMAHVRREHERQPINAVVFVGDAMEENHHELCDAAVGLGIPLFIFQEGDNPVASRTFANMARLSHGAHCRFDTGAAHQLAELLRAVAAFATGGVKALQNQNTDSARKLLGQMRS
jgi:hypothetical protein